MKARVKFTGEIVEVIAIDEDWLFCSDGAHYGIESLEGVESEIDYWTRLEHQAAIAAMQGILGNQTYTKSLLETSTSAKDARNIIVDASYHLAHALVVKLKEKEERK